MMKTIFFILLLIPIIALAVKIEVKPNATAYEFELLIEQLKKMKLEKNSIDQLKLIDINTSKLNRKNKLFFFKNSIYKNILKNDIFSKSRKSITLKEFIRTLNKYNDKKENYTTFSNWIIESILVEYKDLEKATTPEEFRLIAKKNEIKQSMELTSNLVLDFLNLDPKEFLVKIDQLSLFIVKSMYHDALILDQTLKIEIETSEPSLIITNQESSKTPPKKATSPNKDYLPEVDPSTAIDNLDIDDDKENWKPKN